MKITADKIIGDIVTTDIEVSNGATLTIHAIFNGKMKINKDSIVIVHGIVNGFIVNEGLCKIFGVVNGELIEQGGQFIIDEKASINSKQ
jgi:cytoskeletal protein CcmA (bactofilin family)